MVHTQQAQIQLNELKYGIIGLFKNRGSNIFELVTDINDNDTIDVIRVTQFGTIQQEYNLPIEDVIDQFGSETDYNFSSTDEVEVIETEILEVD